jgi:four helix bundle protein
MRVAARASHRREGDRTRERTRSCSRSSRPVRACGAWGEARSHGAPRLAWRMTMFDALELAVKVLERLDPIELRIRSKNNSLAKQLASASESVALNLAEGRGRRDGDKRRHYEIASGSASELTAALRIAVAKRYVTWDELVEVESILDRLRAILWRLTH